MPSAVPPGGDGRDRAERRARVEDIAGMCGRTRDLLGFLAWLGLLVLGPLAAIGFLYLQSLPAWTAPTAIVAVALVAIELLWSRVVDPEPPNGWPRG